MHRLQTLVALAATAVLVGATALAAPHAADAGQKRQQSRQQRPPVIDGDRWRLYRPAPSYPERNYYGPAPGIQQPMERVPLPAPLAQPPTNR
jgi:hypothetical protein